MPSSETWIAECSREQAQQLMSYDHHRVRITGRLAILLTVHWMESDTLEEPLHVKAVFHDAALQHPPTPPDIQTLVDALTFIEAK